MPGSMQDDSSSAALLPFSSHPDRRRFVRFFDNDVNANHLKPKAVGRAIMDAVASRAPPETLPLLSGALSYVTHWLVPRLLPEGWFQRMMGLMFFK